MAASEAYIPQFVAAEFRRQALRMDRRAWGRLVLARSHSRAADRESRRLRADLRTALQILQLYLPPDPVANFLRRRRTFRCLLAMLRRVFRAVSRLPDLSALAKDRRGRADIEGLALCRMRSDRDRLGADRFRHLGEYVLFAFCDGTYPRHRLLDIHRAGDGRDNTEFYLETPNETAGTLIPNAA